MGFEERAMQSAAMLNDPNEQPGEVAEWSNAPDSKDSAFQTAATQAIDLYNEFRIDHEI